MTYSSGVDVHMYRCIDNPSHLSHDLYSIRWKLLCLDPEVAIDRNERWFNACTLHSRVKTAHPRIGTYKFEEHHRIMMTWLIWSIRFSAKCCIVCLGCRSWACSLFLLLLAFRISIISNWESKLVVHAMWFQDNSLLMKKICPSYVLIL